MPNDCWNHITITADKDDLTKLMANEFAKYQGEEEIFSISQRGDEAVRLRIWSAWHPDFELLKGLLRKYPSCWVKNEWTVEDGQAGVWLGTAREGKEEIRQFLWEDMSIEEEVYRFRLGRG